MAGEVDFKDLTGFWTGVYDYPGGLADPVPFNATLAEADGALTGEIVEPDTMCHDALGDLFASLAGAREGRRVSFAKRYESRQNAGHRVDYEGQANAALTEIRGRWVIDGFGGPFVMNRSAAGLTKAVERAEAVDR